MRFYNGQHRHWCGIDLHARTMYVCILDAEGQVLVHRNLKATPEAFLEAVRPYREGLVVAVECVYVWYWLADLCAREEIPFVLGHALYMKAIHGGKAKNDRIDALEIATLLRGGLLPQAYAYPAGMRATRDLLRRRLHLVRKRGQLLAHIQMTAQQYNLPPLGKRIAYPANREGVALHFPDRVLDEMLRIGREAVTSFPNMGHWKCRLQLSVAGHMPVTRSLPHHWYDTPNIHLCTVHDFERLCAGRGYEVLERAAVDRHHRLTPGARLLPNLLGESALFRLRSAA